MGLFKSLQKRPSGQAQLLAPVGGEVRPLAALNDGVFSEALLGPGCIIIPDADEITAPFDGRIVMIASTRHALGLMSEEGIELMLHIGLDTVNMNGDGFALQVQMNDRIKQGQLLMTCSRRKIKDAGYSDAVIVIVTNAPRFKSVTCTDQKHIKRQEVLLSIIK